MRGVFFVVGPTATGKSEIAADVATEVGAEIEIAGGWAGRSTVICVPGKNLGATEPNGHATFQAAASLFFANAMSFMIELIAGWKGCLRMALSKKRATPAR